jgi:hypothetical protein
MPANPGFPKIIAIVTSHFTGNSGTAVVGASLQRAQAKGRILPWNLLV